MTFYAHSRPNPNRESWQELRKHLDSVAATTSSLAEKIGLSHAGELIGLAHDLGKYSEAFQQYLRKAAGDAGMEMEPDFSLKGSVDHPTAGGQIIGDGLASSDRGIASQIFADLVRDDETMSGMDFGPIPTVDTVAAAIKELERRLDVGNRPNNL